MVYPLEDFKYKGEVCETRSQRYLYTFNVPGDGKCFFHSLAHSPSLFQYDANELKAELQLRMIQTLSSPTNNDNELASSIIRIFRLLMIPNNHVVSIEEYLTQRLPDPNHWGGTFEAIMIMLLFQENVGLIDSSGTTMTSDLLNICLSRKTRWNNTNFQELPTVFILHHDVHSKVHPTN